MPSLHPDEILRYLTTKGFLSAAEAELVQSRWRPESDPPLLDYLLAEGLLETEVADDLRELLAESRLDGLEPLLPGLLLLAPVGKGGRGSVYRAWQPALRRVVAVKILSRALAGNREYVRRFQREARVASRINHPHIVRAWDIRKGNGHVFLLMEYVPGVSVGQILRQQGELEPADALEIARQTAEAVAWAASTGLVHRDIKPDNLMIDRAGRLKLCDLGLARPEGESDLTAPLAAQGTPAYISPEGALNEPITPQADVYSLGATLYRMLMGHVPFESSDPVEVLRMHVESLPPGLEESGLPGALTSLVRAMMEKDPARRPLASRLPGEIAALQHSLPGLSGAALWRLVPGGAPVLALETPKPPTPEPVPPALEPIAATPSSASSKVQRPVVALSPARGRPPLFVAGFFVLSAALVASLAAVLYLAFSMPEPTPLDDGRLRELEEEVRRLEEDAERMRQASDRTRKDLREAAERLRAEDAADAAEAAGDAGGVTPEEIAEEMERMRRLRELKGLPGVPNDD